MLPSIQNTSLEAPVSLVDDKDSLVYLAQL